MGRKVQFYLCFTELWKPLRVCKSVPRGKSFTTSQRKGKAFSSVEHVA